MATPSRSLTPTTTSTRSDSLVPTRSRRPRILANARSKVSATWPTASKRHWKRARPTGYGREVGKVIVNGQDVTLEQVRRGMAWHYKAYEREQAPADRVAY